MWLLYHLIWCDGARGGGRKEKGEMSPGSRFSFGNVREAVSQAADFSLLEKRNTLAHLVGSHVHTPRTLLPAHVDRHFDYFLNTGYLFLL